jgi:valyl-tRNA synthetase
LWGHLKRVCQASDIYSPKDGWEEALIVARWPEPRETEGWEDQKSGEFSLVQEIVRAVRNLRAEKQIPAGRKLSAHIAAGDRLSLLREQKATLCALAHLDPAALNLSEKLERKPDNAAALVVSGVEVHLSLQGVVDNSAERDRLSRELANAESQMERLKGLLSSDFGQKAPPALVEKERQKLAVFEETAGKIRTQLKR